MWRGRLRDRGPLDPASMTDYEKWARWTGDEDALLAERQARQDSLRLQLARRDRDISAGLDAAAREDKQRVERLRGAARADALRAKGGRRRHRGAGGAGGAGGADGAVLEAVSRRRDAIAGLAAKRGEGKEAEAAGDWALARRSYEEGAAAAASLCAALAAQDAGAAGAEALSADTRAVLLVGAFDCRERLGRAQLRLGMLPESCDALKAALLTEGQGGTASAWALRARAFLAMRCPLLADMHARRAERLPMLEDDAKDLRRLVDGALDEAVYGSAAEPPKAPAVLYREARVLFEEQFFLSAMRRFALAGAALGGGAEGSARAHIRFHCLMAVAACGLHIATRGALAEAEAAAAEAVGAAPGGATSADAVRARCRRSKVLEAMRRFDEAEGELRCARAALEADAAAAAAQLQQIDRRAAHCAYLRRQLGNAAA